MALTIETKYGDKHNAHVPFNEEFIYEAHKLAVNNQVQSIQADGNELLFIQKRFTNLPSSHSLCIWRGEWARFIAENLSI